jgi:hypothetical protein
VPWYPGFPLLINLPRTKVILVPLKSTMPQQTRFRSAAAICSFVSYAIGEHQRLFSCSMSRACRKASRKATNRAVPLAFFWMEAARPAKAVSSFIRFPLPTSRLRP